MRYSLIDKQIKRLLGRADEALLQALSISPVFGSSGHGSGVSDKVGCGLAEYDCYIGQANELTDKLYEVKKDIVSVLKLMPDVRYRTLLYLRYIKLLSWDKIVYKLIKAQNIVCDEKVAAQYVVEVRTNLHKAALKSFTKYCVCY